MSVTIRGGRYGLKFISEYFFCLPKVKPGSTAGYQSGPVWPATNPMQTQSHFSSNFRAERIDVIWWEGGERGRGRKSAGEEREKDKNKERKTWREKTDSGQSILAMFSMFRPAQMVRCFPLIAPGSVSSSLFMWVGGSDRLCRQQRFGSHPEEDFPLPNTQLYKHFVKDVTDVICFLTSQVITWVCMSSLCE